MANAVMNAAQVTRPVGGEFGQLRVRFADIFFTGAAGDTYIVGGFPIDSLGLRDLGELGSGVAYLVPIGYATQSGAALTTTFVASFDRKTRKLQLFTSNGAAPAALAEATAAVTIAGVLGSLVVTVMVIGQG